MTHGRTLVSLGFRIPRRSGDGQGIGAGAPHRTAPRSAWPFPVWRIFLLSSGRTGWMPRQHTRHSRIVYVFPDDFPRRLERFKEESGLSWAELARRLGTSTLNLRRWKDKGVRPNWQHLVALLELAEELGLGHGRQGDQRPAADPGEQHRVDHHRDARLGRRRDPARHHGLRRRWGRLHGGRQEAVQPERVHRLRPDPIEQGDSAPAGGV